MKSIKDTNEPLLKDSKINPDTHLPSYFADDENGIKENAYSPFLIQKGLLRSKLVNEDNIHFLNMVNAKHIDKKMHFDFLRHIFSKDKSQK